MNIILSLMTNFRRHPMVLDKPDLSKRKWNRYWTEEWNRIKRRKGKKRMFSNQSE